jgi:hypothetical protein
MKKLFFAIVISALLMAVTIVIVWFAPGTCPHDLAAMVNKKEMLNNKPSPRMIFVGGSSVLSIKTPLIEKELPYHMINMSLWGGMGTRDHLDEIRPFLRSGDIVVVTMEYGTILDQKYYDYIHSNEEAKKFFFFMSPERHIPLYLKNGEAFTMLKIIHELCQLKVKSYLRNILTLNFRHLFDIGFPGYYEEFNQNGDRATPYKVFRPLGNRETNFTYPDWSKVVFLNEFAVYAKSHNAQLFFYFSPFPEEQFKNNEKFINAYHDMMAKSFKGKLLNKPSDFMYQEKYFADTAYHLNDEGENIRTPELIRMLKRAL